MNLNKLTPIVNKPSGMALMPLLVFLCLYLVTSIIVNDFYKVPITVAFLVASVYAVATTKGLSLNDRIIQYSSGAANKNIMMMIWIFVLAGAFAQSAKAMGAIDATVNLTMRDKFKMNMLIALPAAIVVFVYYIFYGSNVEILAPESNIEWGKVIPYIIVLVTAVAGVNVMLVLLLGLISTGVIGMAYGAFDFFGWFGAMGEGITGMGELIIITLMAGGMLELIRFNGGVDYILHKLTKKVSGKRGAEFSIAALVSLANVCTANNTIAIITVGPLASEIADEYRIDKRRSASILDIFSCVVQGIIPYGAQMLIAAELARVSPLNIIGYLYYPMVLCIFAILSIIFRIPKSV